MEKLELIQDYRNAKNEKDYAKATWESKIPLSALGRKANVYIFKRTRGLVKVINTELRHNGQDCVHLLLDKDSCKCEYIVLKRGRDGHVKEFVASTDVLVREGWVESRYFKEHGITDEAVVAYDDVLSISKA